MDYATTRESYAALEADPSATQSEHEGWTHFSQKVDRSYIICSPIPEDQPAKPLRRVKLAERPGGKQIRLDLAILDVAGKPGKGFTRALR